MLTQPGRRPRHLHRRRADRQVHRREGGLQAPGARARRQRSDHRDGGRRPRGSGGARRRRARTRTPASAARRSSACSCTRRSPIASSSCCSRRPRAWTYGDPMDPAIDMGTVIDEAAAQSFEARSTRRSRGGAKLLHGNVRRGALYSPTVLDHVTPEMTLVQVRDLRPGLAGDPLRGHRRGDPHRQRHRLRPVVGGLHQPPRLHHALRRRSSTSARSTCARSRATGSS